MTSPFQGTVLVVDDDEAGRYTKGRILRAANFKILEAATGTDALQIARESRPDLVLLDIKLPDIDGFEVCRRLRTDSATASTAIVHITASYERPEHQVRGLEGGADTFLLAPIDPDVLIATVRAMIRLRRAESALRESDRRKDEFLAVLAHELRNPLAPLRYCLQLFQQSHFSDPNLISARQIMERQIAQMVRLIDDLLEISRINQNKLELRKTQAPLAEVLENALETCKPIIDAAGHSVETRRPAEPMTVVGDGVRLTQVFGNLLSNSAKYTQPGGHIVVEVRREGQMAAIAVQDTGIGIAPEELPRVFEMFAQVRRDAEQRSEGLGIGLALVRRLVEMHGGTVSAESAGVGQGSTFIVHLPIVESALASPQSTATRAVPSVREGRKILIADDNVDSAESLAIILESHGHDVRVVHDGLQAVEVAGRFQPAVVLMDVSMPHLSGLEAAREIRRQPWGRDVVIYALTGYGQEQDRRRSLEVGIDRHLVKPVDPQALVALLAQ